MQTNNPLPLEPKLFFTDGGLETTLIFDDGLDLPHFAAFHILRDNEGRRVLNDYFERYIAIAKNAHSGFVLESPTWRASSDWGNQLGYSQEELADINRIAIEQLLELRTKHQTPETPMLVSGCIGPRGDGYDPGTLMSADEAHHYHAEQASVFADAGADLISAITMTNTPEAIGIARAAADAGKPCVISFTVETDGKLPTGQRLEDAITEVDSNCEIPPAYYMINCAHPTHFSSTLEEDSAWVSRIGGLRTNASCKSHAELDEAEELDRGNPAELGEAHISLSQRFPNLRVFGGCCGTDHRHVEAICDAVTAAKA